MVLGLFSTARELPRLREISSVFGDLLGRVGIATQLERAGQVLSGVALGTGAPAVVSAGVPFEKQSIFFKFGTSCNSLHYFPNFRAGRPFPGESWEGGYRAPMVIRWPGHIKPGTVHNQLFAALDWVPTFVDIASGPKGEGLKQQIEAGQYPGIVKTTLDGFNQCRASLLPQSELELSTTLSATAEFPLRLHDFLPLLPLLPVGFAVRALRLLVLELRELGASPWGGNC